MNDSDQNSEVLKIVKTDIDSKNGQDKCPKCGATDISVNVSNGKLRCDFCRHEFEPVKVEGLDEDISKLEGKVLGSGASDIVAASNDVLTFKCSSCGAEVVIDTTSSTQARCHWCRNMLSVNEQIPNGVVPDVVLPFNVSKEDARIEIEKFVSKRKFFAHPQFTKEFTTENIMGVYFPYMIVDVNLHTLLYGKGEHLVNKYTRGDESITYYDADVYNVLREFDLTIDDLTVESNSNRLNHKSTNQTNNVINAIMPFDTENCTKYNSNYLKGFTSEKRDIDVKELSALVQTQVKDIARYQANSTLEMYDRGVAWEREDIQVKGEQWKASYLPVWLYSYQQVNGNNKILHYVAVNARTKKTMGSVPIHIPKLLGISCAVEIIGIVLWILTLDFDFSWVFLLVGVIYFFIMYLRYRNSDARYKHESDTKSNISNIRKVDNYIGRNNGLTNSKIVGVNNNKVSNLGTGFQVLDVISERNELVNMIKNTIDKNGER